MTGIENVHSKQVARDKSDSEREKRLTSLQNVVDNEINPRLEELNNVCRKLGFPGRFEIQLDALYPDDTPVYPKDGEITPYDKKKEFESKIKPHLDAIRRVCIIDDIPYYVTFAVKNSEKGTEYRSMASIKSLGLVLKDDLLSSHLACGRGCKVVPFLYNKKTPDEEIFDAIHEMDQNPDHATTFVPRHVVLENSGYIYDDSPIDFSADKHFGELKPDEGKG